MIKLKLYEKTYKIVKLPFNSNIPIDLYNGEFFQITKTDEELSIICEDKFVLNSQTKDGNWRILKFVENMDLSLLGITAKITKILADAKCNILAEATYNTDFILIKNQQINVALKALRKNGYEIE